MPPHPGAHVRFYSFFLVSRAYRWRVEGGKKIKILWPKIYIYSSTLSWTQKILNNNPRYVVLSYNIILVNRVGNGKKKKLHLQSEKERRTKKSSIIQTNTFVCENIFASTTGRCRACVALRIFLFRPTTLPGIRCKTNGM